MPISDNTMNSEDTTRLILLLTGIVNGEGCVKVRDSDLMPVRHGAARQLTSVKRTRLPLTTDRLNTG
jgi:hypothetical protein